MTTTVEEAKVEYDDLWFVENYVCPTCNAKVKLSHTNDVGTKFFKCEKGGQCSSKLKTPKRKELERYLKDLTKPVTLEEISNILNSTVKHDRRNKLITFACMHKMVTAFQGSRRGLRVHPSGVTYAGIYSNE